MKKTFIVLFLSVLLFASGMTPAKDGAVEIFDIEKGEVIRTLPGNEQVRKEVEKMLNGVTGIYADFNPIPDKGYMVKVPLEPPFRLKNKWFDDYVTEVIVIFPEYENPHLLVFDKRADSFFLTFDHSVDTFLKKIKFMPKSSDNGIFSKMMIPG